MSNSEPGPGTWQEKLLDICLEFQINPPIYELMSDRRGGRTAWSCRAFVAGYVFSARYWYDGQFLNNAREDVAEVAYKALFSSPQTPQTTRSR